MSSSFGPVLLVIGVAIAVVGLIVWTGGVGWFGRLPGDIRFERGSTRVYIPVASMLLVSLVLSIVTYVFRRGR